MLNSETSSSQRVMGINQAAFMALVGLAGMAATPSAMAADNGPGIHGEVWVQPQCPADRNCTDVVLPPQPLKNRALQFVSDLGATIGQAYTNASGRYVITLPPGRYSVTVADGTRLVCPDVWASVSGSRFRAASFVCAMTLP